MFVILILLVISLIVSYTALQKWPLLLRFTRAKQFTRIVARPTVVMTSDRPGHGCVASEARLAAPLTGLVWFSPPVLRR